MRKAHLHLENCIEKRLITRQKEEEKKSLASNKSTKILK